MCFPAPPRSGLHRSAVQLHQFGHQRQADAGAFLRSSARAFHAMKALEKCGSSCSGMPVPVSSMESLALPLARRQPHRDLAFERIFEGVGEEIEHHLLPHLPVHVHRLAKRRAFHNQLQPGLLHGRAEGGGQFRGERRQIRRLIRRLHTSRLDARKIEQRVDQLLEPQAVAVRDGQPAQLTSGGRAAIRRRASLPVARA